MPDAASDPRHPIPSLRTHVTPTATEADAAPTPAAGMGKQFQRNEFPLIHHTTMPSYTLTHTHTHTHIFIAFTPSLSPSLSLSLSLPSVHAQNTTCFFLGICLGIPITSFCDLSLPLRFSFFSLLALLGLFSSYRALSSVRVCVWNVQRGVLVLDGLLSRANDDFFRAALLSLSSSPSPSLSSPAPPSSTEPLTQCPLSLFTPSEVSKLEKFVASYSLRDDLRIHFGSDLASSLSPSSSSSLSSFFSFSPSLSFSSSPSLSHRIMDAADHFQNEHFLLLLSPSPSSSPPLHPSPSSSSPLFPLSSAEIHVLFRNGHAATDRMKALLCALMVETESLSFTHTAFVLSLSLPSSQLTITLTLTLTRIHESTQTHTHTYFRPNFHSLK